MKLVHTADWQIGRQFRFADDETMAVLAAARLDAIDAVAALARRHGAPVVLVAGDVWDHATPSERTLREPVERMRAAGDLAWHLIPGNHDPDRPGGAFERLARLGPPRNVHLHRRAEPVPLGDGFVLLPAPLVERHRTDDPTDAFEHCPTAPGVRRIGLAHGSVRGFGGDGDAGHNRIAPDRASRSGLDYLALGDWHGAQPALGRDDTWYSGTPETDDFRTGGRGGGEALLVSFERARPVVTPHRVGRFRWQVLADTLLAATDVDRLVERLRQAGEPTRADVLIELTVDGGLPLAALERFAALIENGVAHELRLLRVDRTRLALAPAVDELDGFEPGPIRLAADRLAALVAAGRSDAAGALLRLAVLQARARCG